MYDGWGRRFRFAVDPTMTSANTLPVSANSACQVVSSSAITVKDASGSSRTTLAAYAIVSQGGNAHGAYTSNGVMINAKSTNADELINCHCNSSAVATTYTPTYVAKVLLQDPANALNNFDDLVTFKESWQIQTLNFPLSQVVPQCLYAADTGNNRVQKFDMSGNYLGQLGCASGACTLGTGNGQFNAPWGVAVDSSGNVWVVDSNNNRVQEFDSSGTWLQSISGTSSTCASCACTGPGACPTSSGTGNGQLAFPAGIAIDATGNIWVADENNARVEEFSPTGAYLSQFGSSGVGAGQFTGPFGVAFDTNGYIWVTDSTSTGIRVEKFNSSGVFQSQFGSAGTANGQFKQTFGITFDASGNIWVVDSNNHRVQEFNSSGTYIGQIGCATGACTPAAGNGQLHGPTGITIDSSGNLWVLEWGNNRVQKFNSSGTYVRLFGSSGTANGQFSSPDLGIAIGGR